MKLSPSMRWVPLCAESLERMMLGEIHAWWVEDTPDPLRWVLHLRLKRHWDAEEVNLVRGILKTWAEANDAIYRRSQWKGRDLRALLIAKGLGPPKDINPFLE